VEKTVNLGGKQDILEEEKGAKGEGLYTKKGGVEKKLPKTDL